MGRADEDFSATTKALANRHTRWVVYGDGFDDLYIHGQVEYLVFGGVR